MDDGKAQKADVTWREGDVPVSVRFDDPYFSLHDGFAETRHVFLAGNDLPGRFRPGFHIGELGFGTGLNLLAAWKYWVAAGFEGPLQYTSFEACPVEANDRSRALSRWPDLVTGAENLLAALARGEDQYQTHTLIFRLVVGDVAHTLPGWDGQADAWFLDGFSPSRNPAMWSRELMAAVAGNTAPGGTFATYTAAGHVRAALSEAGFEVCRTPGFAGKRHMSRGVLA